MNETQDLQMITRLIAERDAANARIAELEAWIAAVPVRALILSSQPYGACGEDADAIEQWIEALERQQSEAHQ